MREGTSKKQRDQGSFMGSDISVFLVKENAIFKLRYVLSCNVMSLKVLGIVWVCTCWVALFMRWTPCVKPSRTRGLNQKMEIDLFSLYVSIYFTVSDHVMVPQRTFLSNFVLYTVIHVYPCVYDVCTIYETTKANSLENAMLTEVGNKTSKLKRCIIIKRSLWKLVPVAYTRW